MDAMPFSISIVTYMELVQGMRDKRELAKMKKALADMNVEIIPLSEEISEKSVEIGPRFCYNIGVSLCSCAGVKNPRWQADT